MVSAVRVEGSSQSPASDWRGSLFSHEFPFTSAVWTGEQVASEGMKNTLSENENLETGGMRSAGADPGARQVSRLD